MKNSVSTLNVFLGAAHLRGAGSVGGVGVVGVGIALAAACLSLAAMVMPVLHAQSGATLFGVPMGGGESAPAAASAASTPATTAPAAGGANAAPASGAGARPPGVGGGDFSSGSGERSMDKIFDVNRDSVDLQNGTMQWKGKTINLGDSRQVRMRIERYLSAPAEANAEALRHAKLLDEIENLLSPKNLTRTNHKTNFQKAWKLLFEAGSFEIDAGNCLAIGALVEKVWKDGRAVENLKNARERQERELSHQRLEARVRARDLESRRDDASRRPQGGGGGSKSGKSSAPGNAGGGGGGGGFVPTEGTDALSEKRGDVARADAAVKKTETEIAGIELKARLEFQSQIVALLFQRRFKHSLIASAFYRYVFDSTKYELKVGDREIKTMLPMSNFSPTVVSVEMLAREAMKDVDTGMKTVTRQYDNGERYGALQRLQETFLLGEYCPQMMYFDANKKAVLLEVWRNLQTLEKVGDARDLAVADETVNKLKAIATDFPAAQVTSRINNAKRASNLALFAAKQAVFAGNLADVGKHLETATKYWPQNPAVEAFTKQVEGRADSLSTKGPEFDKLLAGKKHRAIFEQKEVFGLAFMADSTRAEKLKKVLHLVAEIEGRLGQVKALRAQNANYLAWDVLTDALRLDADDFELGKARVELAPLVGNYARALSLAEREEKQNRYAASLTWYLAAQDLNPTSSECLNGIKRLSTMVFAQNYKE